MYVNLLSVKQIALRWDRPVSAHIIVAMCYGAICLRSIVALGYCNMNNLNNELGPKYLQ